MIPKSSKRTVYRVDVSKLRAFVRDPSPFLARLATLENEIIRNPPKVRLDQDTLVGLLSSNPRTVMLASIKALNLIYQKDPNFAKRIIVNLNEQERQVLSIRAASMNRTVSQEDIAKEIGRSRSRVTQIEDVMMRKLRCNRALLMHCVESGTA